MNEYEMYFECLKEEFDELKEKISQLRNDCIKDNYFSLAKEIEIFENKLKGID